MLVVTGRAGQPAPTALVALVAFQTARLRHGAMGKARAGAPHQGTPQKTPRTAQAALAGARPCGAVAGGVAILADQVRVAQCVCGAVGRRRSVTRCCAQLALPSRIGLDAQSSSHRSDNQAQPCEHPGKANPVPCVHGSLPDGRRRLRSIALAISSPANKSEVNSTPK